MSAPAAVVWPRPLSPGDEVAVVAPAGPFPRSEFFAGLAWLRQRYRVHVRSDILSATGYLAGDDVRRAAELASALNDPRFRAVIAARGGYGATRLLERVSFADFAARPRWVCGFSDITTLHIEAATAGVASIHSANVTGLAAASAGDRCDFLRALEGDPRPRTWSHIARIGLGERGKAELPRVEGPLFGGNLTLLFTQAAAGRLVPPKGAIWLLEDVGERPYRIDRMLTALAKYFSDAAAIVLGEFTNCDVATDPVRVAEVFEHFARGVRAPVFAGAPFGHGTTNAPWIQGARARLEGTSLVMFAEPWRP